MTRRLFLTLISSPIAAAALAPVNALGDEARKPPKPDKKPPPAPPPPRPRDPSKTRTASGEGPDRGG